MQNMCMSTPPLLFLSTQLLVNIVADVFLSKQSKAIKKSRARVFVKHDNADLCQSEQGRFTVWPN